MDEFADMLLHKLLEAATKGSGDHDKVKSNAVRAVGMLIQYAGPQTLGKYMTYRNVVDDEVGLCTCQVEV